jgi:mercuric reductase
MPEGFDCELLVIGGGSAGTTAAMTAAGFNADRVVLAEKGLIGGTCTNVGCVPSKSYLHAADLIRSTRRAREYGLDVAASRDGYEIVKDHKKRLIEKFRAAGTKALESAGIEIVHAPAAFSEDGEVSIDARKIRPKYVILATGTEPFIPPIEGLAETPYLTSREALDLDSLPKSAVIIGGGYIALELAAFFNTFGVRTTIIEAKDRVAPNEEASISEFLDRSLRKQGIEVLAGTSVRRISGNADSVSLRALAGEREVVLEGEKVIIATGRTPRLSSLNLEAAGVKYGRRGIEVDEYLKTSAPTVYAAGDVLPSLQLEHVGVYEGWLAAQNIFADRPFPAEYRVIPRVMFSYPEVAGVGLTEVQAAEFTEVATVTYPYADTATAQINEEPEGLIKLVADVETGLLLGAHIAGNDAGDLIHLAALAMKHNIEATEIGELVAAYPTLAQGFFYAAGELGEKTRGR